MWRRVLALAGHGAAGPRHETSGQRLARLARWALDGRRRDAVAELRNWRDAPPLGRDLLAVLSGTHALPRPRAPEGSRLIHLARRLPRRHARSRTVSAGEAVEQLAGELACREHLLPSLVAAVRIDPRPATIALLRQAVDRLATLRAGRTLDARLCLAAAELALLDADTSAARRWAMRVCRIDPGNALAAKMLLRTAANPRQKRMAEAALAASLAAHPEYRDLQALARRTGAVGRRAA
jgi:hypothetical protein